MTCPMTLPLLFKVNIPYFDLHLVIQGQSFSLYSTLSCTGILFYLVQVFKILILFPLPRGRV